MRDPEVERFVVDCIRPFGKRGTKAYKQHWLKCHPDKAQLVTRFGADCAKALEPYIGGSYLDRLRDYPECG
jgi:hypothetical protein